jgi:signal transduction histidine kinase/ligand-binding sensor domain-containing protein
VNCCVFRGNNEADFISRLIHFGAAVFNTHYMKKFLQKGILLAISLLGYEVFCQTQHVKFNAVSGTNGVSLGKINCIIRDKHGFVWFSDQSNRCIVRFDGSHMTRYQNDPKNRNSLGGYYPECLLEDNEGNIWVGFYGMGLDKFDPVGNKFTHYRYKKNHPDSLSSDSVTALLLDHLGNIWVGSYGGVSVLNPRTGKFTNYQHTPGNNTTISSNIVRALYQDKAGTVWVGTGFPFINTDEGGLNRFNPNSNTFTRYLHDPDNPKSLSDNRVRAIFEDSRGTFWIGTAGDGLHTMDRKTGLITRHSYDPSNPGKLSRPPLKELPDHITFITEDAMKHIWIGTLANGVIRYDPFTQQMMHYGSKADSGQIFTETTSWWACATPDGYVWMSTQNASLYKIDIFHTEIPHTGNSEKDGVTSFYEENDSIFWYGTYSGLVRKNTRTGKAQRYINVPGNTNTLSNNHVTGLLKDKEGNLWITTIYGLNKMDLQTGLIKRFIKDSNSLSNLANAYISICQDRDSNIWVGTYGDGLGMLNQLSGTFTQYRNIPGNINSIGTDIVTVIFEGDSTDLWIGNESNGGLNRLNRKSGLFKRYLPGLTVTSVHRDREGMLWVGTASGLFRYDKNADEFNAMAEENAGVSIYQIAVIKEDKEGDLWVGSASGLYRLNKKRDQVQRYGKEFGIAEANNNFNYGAGFLKRDGELYFGDYYGYISFYPAKLKQFRDTTKLYFTGFWLNSQEVAPGKNSPLRQSLYDTKDIRLGHNQNVFSFTATFIDFRHAADNKIFYQLENYDPGWRTASPEDRIHYFKVPPGEYVFRIKTASSSNNEWSEKNIRIIISPPWWATWWAYALYGLLFFAGIFFVHRYQKERLIKAEREKTRARELAQAKEIEKAYHELKVTQAQLIQSEKMASLGELTAGIAHEIQNPLNFVNNFSEVNKELLSELTEAIDKENFAEAKNIAGDVIENEVKINEHGRRADAIVKGMLQHSRSSKGQKELTDINSLADEYLRLAYHGIRAKDKGFNATLKTDYDESLGPISLIPQDIGRVFLNLINNAFYAVNVKKKQVGDGYEPIVSIKTGQNNGKVALTITDNGNGIPQSILDKIFQPFFTTKPTGEGTGLGLSLSYDIIRAHGGELKVESGEGKGSAFTVLIPGTNQLSEI